jgi:hypothetical protein
VGTPAIGLGAPSVCNEPAATYERASDTGHSPAAAAIAATESAVGRVAGEFLPRYATARRRI